MSTVKIDFEGLKQTLQVLDQLPLAMQKKIVAASIRESAKPILKDAKQRMPRKTGQLRRTLKIIKYRRTGSPTRTTYAVRHTFSKKMNGEDSKNQYYAAFIHAGTKDRVPKNTKTLRFVSASGGVFFTKKARGIKPNPYLGDAWKANESSVLQDFGQTLNQELQKFCAKNRVRI